ncbi:MAG: diaminopimelate epimerase [Actinomycetota bacterium]
MEFFKYHSLGNDYILLEAMQDPLKLSPEDIRMLCHRHLGIGADGIIVIEPSRRAVCSMVDYNPDGSEADVSGNGLRCLAKHLYETGLYSEPEMEVDTPSGTKRLSLHISAGTVRSVGVNVGEADFRRSAIPMSGEDGEAVDVDLEVEGQRLKATCLSVGNPHCVLFVDHLSDELIAGLGPAIESHHLFPLRINVEFTEVLSISEISLRSWERGAGETMSSATGACAAVAAALRTGRCKRKVHVKLPGGLMEVEVTARGEILTRAPARRVFKGELDEDWRERGRIVLA